MHGELYILNGRIDSGPVHTIEISHAINRNMTI